MSDLTEALKVYPEMHGFPGYEFDECAIVEEAARRWNALPSDEDVEAAAKTICDLDVDFGVKWADLDDHYTDRLAESTRDEYRHAARAALLAVKAR